MNKNYINKIIFSTLFAFLYTGSSVFAIQDLPAEHQSKKWFKRTEKQITLEQLEKKVRKIKGSCGVVEFHTPKVTEFGVRPEKVTVMSIDECVKYAIEHSHRLAASDDKIRVAESGIGQARSNYAPRLFASINYDHSDTKAYRMGTTQSNSIGFNAGISQTIWDFGRTTARINMAQYDTLASHYDYQYEVLNLVYNVRINYYKVLMALANLDIYEQNVRINSLNYERTKAMFDEGLKSKIDVVNAEVNLADAKIQLVEGQNSLESAIIALKDSMDYEEEGGLIVKNTENFAFLNADYREKIRNLGQTKPVKYQAKCNEDGLIMLSSGIEHNDIIKNFELNPLKLTKQDAVDKAMKERPDLKSSRMVQEVQEESLKAIRRQYAPEIAADVSWGYTRMENDNYRSPFQFGAGVGLGSINPYGIHYQVKQGEAYLDIAKHNVNIAICDIFYEVQDNYVIMRQLERKLPLLNTKVKATLENFELADGRYGVGLNNYVELQDALANYNASQLNYVDAVFKYNVARETLLKSMGVN